MRRFRLFLWTLIALRRARGENRKLRAELQKSRVREIALLDRVLTAANQYGLPDTSPRKTMKAKPQRPSVVEPESELERAELEFFQQCASENGLPASDGLNKWRAAKTQRRQMVELDQVELDDE